MAVFIMYGSVNGYFMMEKDWLTIDVNQRRIKMQEINKITKALHLGARALM